MSFKVKTILGVALIQIVLLTILITGVLYFLKNSNEKQLTTYANSILNHFASATRDALIAKDLATLDSVTKEVLKSPEIIYVKIISDGNSLVEGGSITRDKDIFIDSHLSDVTDDVFDIKKNVAINGIEFGTIYIGISTSFIDIIYKDTLAWSIVTAVFGILFVAIFSFFLGNYLTRQINKLTVASKIITDEGPGYQIKETGKDDITALIKAFNSMSLNLKDSYEKLEQSLTIQNNLLIFAHENESKIESILESSLDALIIINQNGIVEEFNTRAEEIFGWKKEEVIDSPLAEFIIPPNLRDAHANGMVHYLETGEGPILGKRIELSALHKEGHEFPVEIAISNIKLDKGEIFTAFIRDITDRKQLETELKLSAEAFESIEAMFISDCEARILRTNKAFTEITGYSEDEVIGKNPRDFLKSGKHNKEFFDEMWKEIRANGHWRGEICNRRKNGEIFPEFLSISAVYDELGHRSHYVAHFTDITEQKTYEEKLLKARRDAEQANEAKSRFLATMSHEIRTPLGAVLGILDMLKQSGLTQEQANLVKTGEHSGKQLLDIINTILDFSRMKAGKLKLKPHPLRLHEIFNTSKEMLNTQAQYKGLELKLSIDPRLPNYARGDATRIRQILINLVNNAIKFTDEGSIIIKSFHKPIDKTRFTLTTQVIDTGIGISEEFQEILFEEFTMNDESHARKQEGSGLGLAISNQLAQLMHGSLRFKSNELQGSTFEFDIELELEAEENVLAYEYRLKPKTVITNKNIKILIAEDNPTNRMLFQSYLNKVGIDHEFAKNGIEAVKAFREKTFDVVFMDISMPEMDGISATHEIRKLETKVPPTPIIALTAHTLEDEINHYKAEGMNDHLAKPCDKESMLSCIDKWTSPNLLSNLGDEKKPQLAPSSSTNNTIKMVDQNVIQQLIRDTSEEIVPELLEFYIKESEKLVSKILEAKANKDAESLEFHSHTLGSSSGAHAAMQLHFLARKVEHLCRDGQPDDAFELIDELEDLAGRTFVDLAKVAEEMSASGSAAGQ